MEIDRFLIFVYLPHGFSVWHPHFVLSIQSIFSILDIYQADDLAISRLLDSLIVQFVLLLKSRVATFFFSSKCSWWAWYRFLYIILKQREDAPQVYAGTSFGLRRHEHPPGVPANPGVERRMHRRQCVCSLHASCNDSILTSLTLATSTHTTKMLPSYQSVVASPETSPNAKATLRPQPENQETRSFL